MMKKMMTWGFGFAMVLALATPASSQSQFETSFEVGVGYARPGIGDVDMGTLLIQGDEFLFESGIGFGINDGINGDTRFSWLIRGAVRSVSVGNTIVHIGGEFSLHTNSALDVTSSGTEVTTLVTLSGLFGVSQPLADHLNFALHVFPLNLAFGNSDTIVRIPTAQLGAHLLF